MGRDGHSPRLPLLGSLRRVLRRVRMRCLRRVQSQLATLVDPGPRQNQRRVQWAQNSTLVDPGQNLKTADSREREAAVAQERSEEAEANAQVTARREQEAQFDPVAPRSGASAVRFYGAKALGAFEQAQCQGPMQAQFGSTARSDDIQIRTAPQTAVAESSRERVLELQRSIA